jgi:hypothetical protein
VAFAEKLTDDLRLKRLFATRNNNRLTYLFPTKYSYQGHNNHQCISKNDVSIIV